MVSSLRGANHPVYEHVILAVHTELYRSGIAFPSQAEVVSLVYRRFASCPDLWAEKKVPVDLGRLVSRGGRRVRRRRVAGADEEGTGTLIARSRQTYNRLVVTGWLEEVRYGLKTTVDMPAGAMRPFGRYLRSVLSALREVDRKVLWD